MPDPVSGTVVATTLLTNEARRRESRRAVRATTQASEEATEATIGESARQFDLTREDTALQRQIGNEALTVLSFLTGVRQAPSQVDIGAMETELSDLRSQLDQVVSAPPAAAPSPEVRTRDAEFRRTLEGEDLARSPDQIPRRRIIQPTAVDRSSNQQANLRNQITDLEQRIEEARIQNNIAREMGEYNGQVPDLNTLFEGVDMPDIDDYISGIGEDLEQSPAYQFEMRQGRRALESTLARNQTAYGGNAMKAAIEYSQDYASTKYDERLQQQIQLYDIDRSAAVDRYRMNLDRYNLAVGEQQRQIGNIMSLASGGAQATQTAAAAGGQHASAVGQATQRHAAVVGQGAQTIAGANISGINQLGNTALTLATYNQNRYRPSPPPGSNNNRVLN